MESLEVLFQRVSETDLEEFVELYPHPFLVSEVGHDTGAENDSFQTMTSSKPQQTTAPKSSALHLEAVVVPVRKKARGKFSNMISVGRTPSNDVTVDSASVSKFHAYFIQRSEGVWFIQDANSSNGTFVNGRRIAAETPTALNDGMTVQFSPDTRYRFYSPSGLYNHLLESASGKQ